MDNTSALKALEDSLLEAEQGLVKAEEEQALYDLEVELLNSELSESATQKTEDPYKGRIAHINGKDTESEVTPASYFQRLFDDPTISREGSLVGSYMRAGIDPRRLSDEDAVNAGIWAKGKADELAEMKSKLGHYYDDVAPKDPTEPLYGNMSEETRGNLEFALRTASTNLRSDPDWVDHYNSQLAQNHQLAEDSWSQYEKYKEDPDNNEFPEMHKAGVGQTQIGKLMGDEGEEFVQGTIRSLGAYADLGISDRVLELRESAEPIERGSERSKQDRQAKLEQARYASMLPYWRYMGGYKRMPGVGEDTGFETAGEFTGFALMFSAGGTGLGRTGGAVQSQGVRAFMPGAFTAEAGRMGMQKLMSRLGAKTPSTTVWPKYAGKKPKFIDGVKRRAIESAGAGAGYTIANQSEPGLTGTDLYDQNYWTDLMRKESAQSLVDIGAFVAFGEAMHHVAHVANPITNRIFYGVAKKIRTPKEFDKMWANAEGRMMTRQHGQAKSEEYWFREGSKHFRDMTQSERLQAMEDEAFMSLVASVAKTMGIPVQTFRNEQGRFALDVISPRKWVEAFPALRARMSDIGVRFAGTVKSPKAPPKETHFTVVKDKVDIKATEQKAIETGKHVDKITEPAPAPKPLPPEPKPKPKDQVDPGLNFVSGVERSPADSASAISAGGSAGMRINENLSGPAKTQLVDLTKGGKKVFLEHGLYKPGLMEAEKSSGFINLKTRLQELVKLGAVKENMMVVLPDQLDSAVGTKGLAKEAYRNFTDDPELAGIKFIYPMQRLGAGGYFGTESLPDEMADFDGEQLTIGIPANLSRIRPDELRNMLMNHGLDEFTNFHLLGIDPSSERAKALIEIIREEVPDAVIGADTALGRTSVNAVKKDNMQKAAKDLGLDDYGTDSENENWTDWVDEIFESIPEEQGWTESQMDTIAKKVSFSDTEYQDVLSLLKENKSLYEIEEYLGVELMSGGPASIDKDAVADLLAVIWPSTNRGKWIKDQVAKATPVEEPEQVQDLQEEDKGGPFAVHVKNVTNDTSVVISRTTEKGQPPYRVTRFSDLYAMDPTGHSYYNSLSEALSDSNYDIEAPFARHRLQKADNMQYLDEYQKQHGEDLLGSDKFVYKGAYVEGSKDTDIDGTPEYILVRDTPIPLEDLLNHEKLRYATPISFNAVQHMFQEKANQLMAEGGSVKDPVTATPDPVSIDSSEDPKRRTMQGLKRSYTINENDVITDPEQYVIYDGDKLRVGFKYAEWKDGTVSFSPYTYLKNGKLAVGEGLPTPEKRTPAKDMEEAIKITKKYMSEYLDGSRDPKLKGADLDDIKKFLGLQKGSDAQRDKIYERLKKLKKTLSLGQGMYEITILSKVVKAGLTKDPRLPFVAVETNNFILREKADVTGDPQDTGWILRDKNERRGGPGASELKIERAIDAIFQASEMSPEKFTLKNAQDLVDTDELKEAIRVQFSVLATSISNFMGVQVRAIEDIVRATDLEGKSTFPASRVDEIVEAVSYKDVSRTRIPRTIGAWVKKYIRKKENAGYKKKVFLNLVDVMTEAFTDGKPLVRDDNSFYMETREDYPDMVAEAEDILASKSQEDREIWKEAELDLAHSMIEKKDGWPRELDIAIAKYKKIKAREQEASNLKVNTGSSEPMPTPDMDKRPIGLSKSKIVQAQNAYLKETLEKAIKNAPDDPYANLSNADGRKLKDILEAKATTAEDHQYIRKLLDTGKLHYVLLQVPYDGVFRILNYKKNLQAFLGKRVKGATKPSVVGKPGKVSGGRLIIPARPHMNVQKIAEDFVYLGDDAMKRLYDIPMIYNGKQIVATDGHRLFVAPAPKGSKLTKAKDHMHKAVFNTLDKLGSDEKDYLKLGIPKHFLQFTHSLDEIGDWAKGVSIENLTADHKVTFHTGKDGKYAIRSAGHQVQFNSINHDPSAPDHFSMQTQYFVDAIKAGGQLGATKIEFRLPKIGPGDAEPGHFIFRNDKNKILGFVAQMPVRNDRKDGISGYILGEDNWDGTDWDNSKYLVSLKFFDFYEQQVSGLSSRFPTKFTEQDQKVADIMSAGVKNKQFDVGRSYFTDKGPRYDDAKFMFGVFVKGHVEYYGLNSDVQFYLDQWNLFGWKWAMEQASVERGRLVTTAQLNAQEELSDILERAREQFKNDPVNKKLVLGGYLKDMSSTPSARAILVGNQMPDINKAEGREAFVAMAQPLRSPHFEYGHLVGIKDGKIVRTETVTARLSNATQVAQGKSPEEVWTNIQNFADGVDQVLMVHNHPSGAIQPSIADREAHLASLDKIKNYAGSLIINHGKYSYMPARNVSGANFVRSEQLLQARDEKRNKASFESSSFDGSFKTIPESNKLNLLGKSSDIDWSKFELLPKGPKNNKELWDLFARNMENDRAVPLSWYKKVLSDDEFDPEYIKNEGFPNITSYDVDWDELNFWYENHYKKLTPGIKEKINSFNARKKIEKNQPNDISLSSSSLTGSLNEYPVDIITGVVADIAETFDMNLAPGIPDPFLGRRLGVNEGGSARTTNMIPLIERHLQDIQGIGPDGRGSGYFVFHLNSQSQLVALTKHRIDEEFNPDEFYQEVREEAVRYGSFNIAVYSPNADSVGEKAYKDTFDPFLEELAENEKLYFFLNADKITKGKRPGSKSRPKLKNREAVLVMDDSLDEQNDKYDYWNDPLEELSPASSEIVDSPIEYIMPDGTVVKTHLNLEAIPPIKLPEFVELIEKLMGERPVVKNIGRKIAGGGTTYGYFSPRADGAYIAINRDIFEYGGDSATKTTAHEFSHFLDYMDSKNMNRGNILGRIKSAINFKGQQIPVFMGHPGASGPIITPKERQRLRYDARKQAEEEIVIEWLRLKQKLASENNLPEEFDNDPGGREAQIKQYAKYLAKKENTGLFNIEHELKEKIKDTGRKIYIKKLAEMVATSGVAGNTEVRAELLALMDWWKPIPKSAPKDYIAYRQSGEELYADTVSLLLMAPNQLQKRAPVFFQLFMEYLKNKPKVNDALLEMWELIRNLKPSGVAQRRSEARKKTFKDAGEQMTMQDREQRELYKYFDNWWRHVQTNHYDYAYGIVARTRKAKKDNPDRKGNPLLYDWSKNPENIWGMHPMSNNEPYLFLNSMHQKVISQLPKEGLTTEDLGNFLFLTRVAQEKNARLTGRSQKANPGGVTKATSKDELLAMHKTYSSKQIGALRFYAKKTRDLFFDVYRDMYKAGLLTPRQYARIKYNKDNYATFSVLEYLLEEGFVPSGIYETIGTIKDIANPVDAMMLKATCAIKVMQWQKVKMASVELLEKYFPNEIEELEHKFVYDPVANAKLKKYNEKEERKHLRNEYRDQGVISVKRNGKLFKYVVPWDVAVAEKAVDPTQMDPVTKALNFTFRNGFYPLYISYNPYFQLISSPTKDFRRSVVNLPPGKNRFQLLLDWIKNYKESSARMEGKVSPLIAEMMSVGAIGTPYDNYAQRAYEDPDSIFGLLLEKYNLSPKQRLQRQGMKATKTFNALMKIPDLILKAGQTFETLAKVAPYKVLTRDLGVPPLEAGEYVRNYMGVPPWQRSGSKVYVQNSWMPFSNVALKGYMADWTLASGRREPLTMLAGGGSGGKKPPPPPGNVIPGSDPFGNKQRPRGKRKKDSYNVGANYWFRYMRGPGLSRFLKTMIKIGVGMKGYEMYRRAFDYIPEYDEMNYDCWPLGYTFVDKEGETQYVNPFASELPAGAKVIYARIPIDETHKLIGGIQEILLLELGAVATGDPSLSKVGQGSEIARWAYQQTPGMNPLWEMIGVYGQYATGRNPIDPYRGNTIMTDAEYKSGGSAAFSKVFEYTLNETGLSNFYKSDTETDSTMEFVWKNTPGLNATFGRLIKISDHGLTEKMYQQELILDKRYARIRTDMGDETQRLYKIYSRLKNFRTENRDEADINNDWENINYWHRTVYSPTYDDLKHYTDILANPNSSKQTRSRQLNLIKKYQAQLEEQSKLYSKNF